LLKIGKGRNGAEKYRQFSQGNSRFIQARLWCQY